MKEGLVLELESVRQFFERSTSCLQEEDSGFRPADGMMSVAQQVAHAAKTVDWFMNAIQSPEGFDMEFEKHWEEIHSCTSLSEARTRFTTSIDQAKQVLAELSEEQLLEPLPEGPVMGGAPKLSVIGGISEHTAHHRGALSVYSRLLGKVPKMPYMEL